MENVIELFNAGGYMMYPLLLFAFIALVLIIERIFALRMNRILVPSLVQIITKMTKEEDLTHAEQLSKSNPGPFSNIIEIVFENKHLSQAELHQAVEDQGQFEVRYLEKGLGIIETIAGTAPLMGLLGTVLGIIKVFDQIKVVGLDDPGVFSGGISEALITTAFGLVIGIIVLISYNLLAKKAENLVAEIQNYAVQIILKIKRIDSKKNEIK